MLGWYRNRNRNTYVLLCADDVVDKVDTMEGSQSVTDKLRKFIEKYKICKV